ncbi:MAG: hypothetical protein ACKVPX_11995 [Myxococcaceae bacterium]
MLGSLGLGAVSRVQAVAERIEAAAPNEQAQIRETRRAAKAQASARGQTVVLPKMDPASDVAAMLSDEIPRRLREGSPAFTRKLTGEQAATLRDVSQQIGKLPSGSAAADPAQAREVLAQLLGQFERGLKVMRTFDPSLDEHLRYLDQARAYVRSGTGPLDPSAPELKSLQSIGPALSALG